MLNPTAINMLDVVQTVGSLDKELIYLSLSSTGEGLFIKTVCMFVVYCL